MIRRHGQPDGFWGQYSTQIYQNVPASGTSNIVQLGQGTDQFVAYINVNGPTTITVQVAPAGALTSDGSDPNYPPPASAFMNLYWNATPINVTFTAPTGGTAALIVPDFAPGWVRLTTTNAVGAICGWEVSTP